ncbi:addiction module antidote protein [Agrobacterium rosae]|uniref:addiction module antidote protein n=1 Tax=Agrobacterium rosae TaxID=1972867 RepID=UPI000CD83866|nr:addiction module antidote protein [Agrobacterium rosae]POO51756.1 putative addiction module antidote protein [Agrobacterium rosae]
MPLETFEYDSAEFLGSEEAIAEYLLAASEDGDANHIARALGVVARARGMSNLSRNTGLTRPALYRALSGDGNPEFGTIAKVADALGYRLNLVLKSDRGSTAAVK